MSIPPPSPPLSHDPSHPFASYLLATYDALLFAASSSQPFQQQLKTSHKSLSIIKNFLVGATLGVGNSNKAGSTFIGLQSRLEFNATIILLRWISIVSHRILDQDPSSTNQDDIEIVNQASTAVAIMQGLLHLHPASQRLFASHFNLQILLKFLSPSLEHPCLQSLTLPLLDLLVTTFIDSAFNKQLFESSGGLEILIKAMKNRKIRKEVRVKVLETVWGWWIDEESEEDANDHAIFRQSGLTPVLRHSRNQSSPVLSPGPKVEAEAVMPDSGSRARQAHGHDRTGQPVTRDRASSVATPGNPRLRPNSLPRLIDAHPPEANNSEKRDRTPRASAARPRTRKMSLGGGTPSSPASQPRPSLTERVALLEQEQAKLLPSSSPMTKTSSASSAHSRSGDPTIRLRQMLENTASDFVPATPRHPRIQATPRRMPASPSQFGLNKSHPPRRQSNHGSSESEDIPEETDEEVRDSTPTKLFINKTSRRTTAQQQGGNTPQRMLRHKQSASLGSIQQHQLSEKPNPFVRGSDRTEKRRSRTDLPLLEGSSRKSSSRSSSSEFSSPPSSVSRAAGHRLAVQTGTKGVRPSGFSLGVPPSDARPATPQDRSRVHRLTPTPQPPQTDSPHHLRPPATAPNFSTSPGKKTFVTKPATACEVMNVQDVEQMINEVSDEFIQPSQRKSSSSSNHHEETRKVFEKYMGNSDQLLKRFEEMKVGLELVIRPSHSKKENQRTQKVG